MDAPPDLELDDDRRRGLARAVEDAARALGAVRYGTSFRVGAAHVVLNPDSPMVTSGFAAGLDGDPGLVEQTLLALPEVWAEAGRSTVVVLASPSSAPELELLAEETGYEAETESAVLLLTRPARLVEGEPGRLVRPVPERDEERVLPVLAEAFGWPRPVVRRLGRHVGHRLDDPRHLCLGAYEDGELVGVGTGFVHGALGQVVEVGVVPSARRRRLGRALASGVAAELLTRGAQLVWTTAEARGTTEAFWTGLGFEAAYDTVTYTLPVE